VLICRLPEPLTRFIGRGRVGGPWPCTMVRDPCAIMCAIVILARKSRDDGGQKAPLSGLNCERVPGPAARSSAPRCQLVIFRVSSGGRPAPAVLRPGGGPVPFSARLRILGAVARSRRGCCRNSTSLTPSSAICAEKAADLAKKQRHVADHAIVASTSRTISSVVPGCRKINRATVSPSHFVGVTKAICSSSSLPDHLW